MLDWFRIEGSKLVREDGPFETRLYEMVIGQEVMKSKCLRLEIASRSDNVRPVRQTALDLGDQFRIQTELQYRSAPGLARQLCVHHFIRPASESTWPIHSQQDVCPATPAPGVQVSLDDCPCTRLHCIQRPFEPAGIVKTALVSQDLASTFLQMIQVGHFMPQSALGKNINRRIVPVRPFDVSARGKQVQRRQVPACQMFSEVGRRKLE